MFKGGIISIFVLICIFTTSIISYFLLQNNYFESSEINYTSSLRREIKSEIKTQKHDTLALAKNLALNKKLIDIMKSSNFQALYTNTFFENSKEYFHYENIKIHIIGKKGISRYFSWTNKNLGKDALIKSEKLKSIFKKPHSFVDISVNKFGIDFRAIMPIYDKNHNFLGVVEITSTFESIFKELQNNMVYSIIIINKKFNNLLKTSSIKTFKQNYIISNHKINLEFIELFKKYKINYFTNIKTYKFVPKTDEIVDGYYVLNIPILNSKNQTLGYYLAFVYDRFELAQKGIALLGMIVLMTIIFIITVYLVFKKHTKGLKHISNLDKEVQNQIDEKLKLLHMDTTTNSYRKIKFKEDIKQHKNSNSVMLNIRNFSKINEAYGFDIGDMILKITVKRIENILQRKIYRIASDKFSFFSYNHKKEIRAIKRKFINDSMKINDGAINLRISFSFGVVHTREENLLSKLSIATKEAKNYPFSDFIFYKKREIKDNFIKYNSLLYDAIFIQNEAQIVPYFQGIMNNTTGEIIKYEALARIKSKNEIYSPFHFIDIAKNSGFLHEITEIMIEKSYKYIASLNRVVEISINITEDDLFTHKLEGHLLKMSDKYNINPNRITLEVLEGITADGAKNNIKQLKKLKEAGFKIAIDDFGIEYSNFERISELDIDFIKIDKKYIKTIHTNPKSLKITKTINDFAHSLDIEVIAEFVENEDIQKIVKELGIEFSQGYLFCKPTQFID
ncbi:MAG: EAL domain-containing protein [Epsilonproteobacteria bacterium]|nr:EAL domain-containing protein [Campylobacterota bacterium]